jgi:3-hydroxyisobutyrate dehydrogenase
MTTEDTMQLAWTGLGAMGRPMAANLATRFPTLVHNRTASVAEAHATEHGTTAADLDGLAAADVVFSCLPTTAEVAATVAALRDELRPGTVWVDCTSGDPAGSRDVADQLAELDVTYLDAPVSGGTDGAEAGRLTMMVGGSADALAQVRPALEAMATTIVHVGPVGAGHAVKAINNTLLAANLWLASEGLTALARLGVDPTAALEVINGSSGRSFPSERLIPERVVTREFPATFALGLLAKDAGIGEAVLDDAAVPAPMLRQVPGLIRLAASELGADVDHSAAARLVERWAGVELH